MNIFNQFIRLTVFLAVIGGLLIACNSPQDKEQKSTVIIAGKITNPTGDSAFVKIRPEIGWETYTYAAALSEDGSYKIEFKLSEPKPGQFSDGNEVSAMFLYPGDSLFLTLDTDLFDETIIYTGTNTAENNYLAAKYLDNESNELKYWELADSVSSEKYLALFKSKRERELALFETHHSKSPFREEFIKLEKTDIDYDFATFIYLYISMKRDRKAIYDTVNIPVEYYDIVESHLNYTNPDKYSQNFNQFLNFIPGYLMAVEPIDSTLGLSRDSINVGLITTKLDGYMKEKAFTYIMYTWLTIYKVDWFENHRITFDSVVQNHEFKSYVINKYKEVKKDLEKEIPENARLFDIGLPENKDMAFEDILNKYKGKVIYLDFWASWCGPCKAEMPHSIAMQKHFKDKDVAFVFISTDRKADEWERMIKILQITGEHYRSFKAGQKAYNNIVDVRYIPRYMIIDKEGNVSDTNAKRPSNRDVYADIEELLNSGQN